MFKCRLISCLFFVLGSIGSASAQYGRSTLVPPDSNWTINFDSRVGSSTRIKATDQEPFPFCFATAAAMLWDQQRCTADKKDCATQTASSFLAAVPAGQRLGLGSEIDLKNGGSPLLSLYHLVQKGAVSYDRCNYSQIPPNSSSAYVLTHHNNPIRQSWLKYRDYTPYLERYYKREFFKFLRNYNPKLADEQAEIILHTSMSDSEFAALLLVNSDCWTHAVRDNRFTINWEKIENRSNAKKAFKIINNLLEQQKPVIIIFCRIITDKEDCGQNNDHSVIIVAKAMASNEVTGDQRTVFWIVNSWGEKWQQENRDGWVFADALLNGINGELIWLEQ